MAHNHQLVSLMKLIKAISANLPLPLLFRRGYFLFFCFLLWVGPVMSADRPPAGTDLRTDHFLLYVETLNAEETGRFLEAAYVEMKSFFRGLEPDRKIQVKIYATRERYQSEMDHLRKIFSVKRRTRDLAGLYLRETACSYLFVQPQEYETRKLLLHEVAHQFHDYLRPWSRVPSLDFCEEGIAEFFALHNWDGKTLKLGIVPAIGQIDYAKAALQQLRNTARFDMESIVAGDTEVDYPLAWGLVSFLIDRHRAKFDIWRQGINNDVEPRVVWQKQFGTVMPEIIKSFEPWLQSNVSPWQVVSGEWSPAGQAIEGRGQEDEFTLAILNETPPGLAVTLVSSQSNACGGAVFGFRGAKNFHVIQRGPDGQWELMHYEGNHFPKDQRRRLPSVKGTSVTIVPGEGLTTLNLDGHTVTVSNATGRVGLWVKEGQIRFHCSSDFTVNRTNHNPSEDSRTGHTRIMQYGIYKVEGQGRQVFSPDVPNNKQTLHSRPIVFLKETNRIPAVLGVQFGYTFEIAGLRPDTDVDLVAITSYPPIKSPDGKEKTKHTWSSRRRSSNQGTLTSFVGYHFEEPYELATGNWTMEIWSDGKPLLRKEFVIFDPIKEK